MPKLPTEMEEEVDGEEHRLGDEVEPAPIDQQIEMVEVKRLVVAAVDREREIDADHRDFLGAGEQPRIGGCGRARRDGLRIEQVIGLVGLLAAGFAGGEARVHLGVGVGQ